MDKIVFIGGGGHCKSVIDAALRSKQFTKIYITDAELEAGTKILGCEVVGPDDKLPELFKEGITKAFITVGFIKPNDLRSRLYDMAKKMGFSFPDIVDPSAVVSDFAQLGSGVFVGKNAVINAGAIIGNNAIINTGAIVEHDCVVGEGAHIAIGAKLCGECKVGAGTLIGAGATVLQGIEIGDNAVIGAGAVVTRNVGSSCTSVGIPARIQSGRKRH
ncbi:acetyltransferase [Butyrivibrio sp. JL13D10]|uniref:acetyltransferase n=1 Tax=Butyrivibrio sp. JL13D10 TaxID=3236815 RepID=UPI0038B459EE